MKWLERKPVLFLLLTLSFAAVCALNNALTAVLNSGLNQLVIDWNGLSQDLLSGLGVIWWGM